MWIYSYTPIYSCTCNYLSSIEKGHFISPFFSPLVKPAREVPGRLRTHCISSFSTKVLLTLYCAEGNGNPRMLWYSCLGNPMNRGAWWATVHGVTGVRHNLATKPPPTLYWDEQVIALFSWYRVNKHFLALGKNFVVQSLSHVWLFSTPWTVAHQASLSFTISQNLLKLMSIESMMPSNHFIFCLPLLLPPSVFPSIWVFSDE